MSVVPCFLRDPVHLGQYAYLFKPSFGNSFFLFVSRFWIMLSSKHALKMFFQIITLCTVSLNQPKTNNALVLGNGSVLSNIFRLSISTSSHLYPIEDVHLENDQIVNMFQFLKAKQCWWSFTPPGGFTSESVVMKKVIKCNSGALLFVLIVLFSFHFNSKPVPGVSVQEKSSCS